MAEPAPARRSALHEIYRAGDFGAPGAGPGVKIAERRDLGIIQVAAFAGEAEAVAVAVGQASGVRPSGVACSAVCEDGAAAIWVGPDRWLIVGKAGRDLERLLRAALPAGQAAITNQGHSRCVLRLTGPEVRNVLRKGATLDLDAARFRPGEARATGLFHINALLHCRSEDSFDIYVARSFGRSFFELITHAAAEYGYRVEAPI